MLDVEAVIDSVLEDREGLKVLTWPVFDDMGIDVIVTTRAGGVSEGAYSSLNLGMHVGDEDDRVVENRERAALAAGAKLDDLVFARQTHGRGVAVVDGSHRGTGARSEADAIADTDALVTSDAGVGLVMMAADCTPIVLADPVAGVVGCVHSGWRGTVARVTEAAVSEMVRWGAKVERIVAAVGPNVAADRYQVGEDVVAGAKKGFGDLDGLVEPDGTGRWTFDLWAANLRLLAEVGIRPDNTHRSEWPTGTAGGELFFSDREARPCGRLAAIIRRR